MNDISILLVERSQADLSYTRACLSKAPGLHIIGACTDSASAIAFIRIHHPDLVICEMVLCGSDGLSLLRHLPTDGKRPIFLLTSAIASDLILQDAQSLGADYFLIKPYNADQLTDTVHALQRRRQMLATALPQTNQPRQIHRLLTETGFTSNAHGYHYLVTAISLLLNEPDMMSSLTKRLYVEIAARHQTSAACVERNMRHAIHVTCRRMGMPELSNGAMLRMLMRILKQEASAGSQSAMRIR